MKLIPFDLEKAKAGYEVYTRDGKKVTDWHHFKSLDGDPNGSIIVCLEGSTELEQYYINGLFFRNEENGKDLMIKIKSIIKFLIFIRSVGGEILFDSIHDDIRSQDKRLKELYANGFKFYQIIRKEIEFEDE